MKFLVFLFLQSCSCIRKVEKLEEKEFGNLVLINKKLAEENSELEKKIKERSELFSPPPINPISEEDQGSQDQSKIEKLEKIKEIESKNKDQELKNQKERKKIEKEVEDKYEKILKESELEKYEIKANRIKKFTDFCEKVTNKRLDFLKEVKKRDSEPDIDYFS